MLQFLEDCQFFMKTCGYSLHDPTENGRYRSSRAMNHFLTFLFVYYIGTCILFILDDRQPRNERILQILCVVAYSEQAFTHVTLTTSKSEIFEFFNHYETLANQSKCKEFQRFYLD